MNKNVQLTILQLYIVENSSTGSCNNVCWIEIEHIVALEACVVSVSIHVMTVETSLISLQSPYVINLFTLNSQLLKFISANYLA